MAYPGYPHYLQAGARALQLKGEQADGAVRIAKRQAAVIEISSLVVQALGNPDGPHPDTIRRVRELVEGLYVAAEGAERMLALIMPKSNLSGKESK